jgi:hypothetical protein
MKKVLNILLLTGTLAKSGNNQARLERMMRNNESPPNFLVQSSSEESVEAKTNAELSTEEASIAQTLESEVAEDINQTKQEKKLIL